MSNLAITAISLSVGLFFAFFGILKLAPIFSDDLYRDMRKVFIRYAKVFPLVWLTGWRPTPHQLRRVYGTCEVVCGLLLALCPGAIKEVANAILLLLMFYSVYSVWMLGQGLKESSHCVVFGLLLTCRLVIKIQSWNDHKTVKDNDENIKRKHLHEEELSADMTVQEHQLHTESAHNSLEEEIGESLGKVVGARENDGHDSSKKDL